VLSAFFKITLRQMRNVYSLINLIGLMVGLAAFALIYLWVIEELSYDQFHSNHDKIFRVVENQYNESGEAYPLALTPGPLGPYLKNSFAEIDQVCRLAQLEFLVRHDDQSFYQNGIAADPEFFDLFSFPLVSGETKSFHTGIDKIIISEKLASVFFGDDTALGKIFKIADRDFVITAVMQNVPTHSHLQFDFALPFNFLETAGFENPNLWNQNGFHTYLSLQSVDESDSFEGKIRNAIKVNHPESTTEIGLQPLKDIHLKSTHLNNDMAGRGNFQYVTIFSAIGIFILLVASINYANLATARSIKRAKEAGVRKVIGANRVQLILHFFSESFLYSFLALGAALLVVWGLLPSFNLLTGKSLSFNILDPAILISLLSSVIFCTLLGGAYPALVLSSLNPVAVFKGYAKSGKGAVVLRRTIVIVQFILSISFLTGTLIIKNQLHYIQSRQLGFNKDNVLTFSANRKLRQQYTTFKSELQNVPGVISVTATNCSLSDASPSTWDVEWEGKNPDEEILFHRLVADHDFLNTYSIGLAAGRDFSILNSSDSTGVLVNEEAIRQMGIDEPLHKIFTIEKTRKYTLLGIVKDFHFESIHKPIEPIIIYIEPSGFSEVSVRLAAGNTINLVNDIEGVFKKFNPGRPFEYSFLNDDIDKLYRSEKRVGEIFTYFSVLSIFVSCLGLFGLVMFVTEQRAKEVALRKIMGASIIHLIWLLTFEFIALVVVAFFIASPVMYYTSGVWLENFAYKVNPGVSLFLLSGLVCILIAWVTVGVKSYRVSKSNPIDPLRSE
jgi:putative ABC transport system permease protein